MGDGVVFRTMRITGGRLRGRRIAVPSAGVRPTQDRVREALFSMIADRIVGCRFLDLFAGSGAVGLEAWSRGACEVWWVESDRRVAGVLERNVVLCPDAGRVLRRDVFRALAGELAGGSFDLIYADPPYGAGGGRDEMMSEALASGIVENEVAADGGLFVMEQSSGGPVASAPAGWAAVRDRTYGDARLLVWQRTTGTVRGQE